jgi:hypothetical protein
VSLPLPCLPSRVFGGISSFTAFRLLEEGAPDLLEGAVSYPPSSISSHPSIVVLRIDHYLK